MKIIIPGERPISWNKFYSGMHWTERKKEADRVHDLVYAVCYKAWQNWGEYVNRVDIHITAYFENRAYDPDNICAKLYIDGLVKLEIIANDTRAYIRCVTTQSEIDKENPRLEIEITEIKDV